MIHSDLLGVPPIHGRLFKRKKGKHQYPNTTHGTGQCRYMAVPWVVSGIGNLQKALIPNEGSVWSPTCAFRSATYLFL